MEAAVDLHAGQRALSPRHVLRPRLTRLLDAAAGQAIVVTAPAGYGKTMLAREWLVGKRVAWYHATAATADVTAFSFALAEAARPLVPEAGARLRDRARVDETPEESARPLAELLAEDLAAWPEDAWLVVDDYHLVAGSAAVEEFIDWLLTLAPVRLLVTTRRRPSWASARRILYGEIVEIGRDDLAMTAEEAAAVVEGHPDADVAALLEQAQGWPAVIGLAGLSSSFAAPSTRISDALFRYFAEEVFRREPPSVQQFMLAAAVLPRVDARAAADVLELERPEAAMQRLHDEGLLHEAGDAVRFHPLLRDFLLRKLRDVDPQLRTRIYDRAIAAAREGGRVEEAFELAIEAGRAYAAADVMRDVAADLLDLGRLETVERWLEACGKAALTHVELALAHVEVLIRRRQLFEASALASDIVRRLSPDDASASTAWYLAGRCFHLLSQDARALECHLKASEYAKNPREATNALWGAITLAAQLESDVLERLVRDLEAMAVDDVDARLQLPSAWVFLASRRGSLTGLRDAVEPLVHLADQPANPMAAASLLLAGGYLNISAGRYRRGYELAERSVALCERYRLGRTKSAFCLCQRASAEIGRRRLSDAEATLAELESFALEQTHVLVWEQRNLRAKLLISLGSTQEAARSVAPPAVSAPKGALAEFMGLTALAAAGVGDAETALARADRADSLSTAVEPRTYSRLARAIAADGVGAVAAATSAIADGAADAIVHAYRAWPPLLDVLAADASLRPQLVELVQEAGDQALARRAGLGGGRNGADSTPGALTHREQEVLGLIAEGLSNAEISRRLFISEKTTKVHVHHIFAKLGVTSRVQAVLAARKLVPASDGPG